jgi:hypothetical protein
MLFGLVTRAELRDALEGALEDVTKLKRKIDELEFEWSSWYDKYRLLYLRLTKREKSLRDPPGDANGDATEPEEQSLPLRFRSRRGF